MSIYELHHGISLPEDPPVFDLRLVERDIYGSSRVGTETVNQTIASGNPSHVNIDISYTRTVGDKRYELSNHLGNVLEVVTDRKLQIETAPESGVLDYYSADVVSQSDYFPFGMLLPNTNVNPVTGVLIEEEGEYRYAFNGMEKDDEVRDSKGTSYTTEFRQYDPRVGRWLSLDPLAGNFPWQSPFLAFDNSPIGKTDIRGDKSDWHYEKDASGNTILVADPGDTYQSFANQYKIGDGSTSAYLQYFMQNGICPGCDENTIPYVGTTDPETPFLGAIYNENTQFKGGESFIVSSFGLLKNPVGPHGPEQLAFAYRDAKSKGQEYFKMTDYFNYVSPYAGTTLTFKGSINVNGEKINVEVDVQWYDLGGETGFGTLKTHLEKGATREVQRGAPGVIEQKRRLVGRVNKKKGSGGNAFEAIEFYVDPANADKLLEHLNGKDIKTNNEGDTDGN